MSPTLLDEQHFIKPLFIGFEDQLLIPAAFMKYLKGRKGETAMLRSRREGKLWPVKINGRQFGDGWKQFVQDHDLQIGEILLFRLEGDLLFYVSVLGHNTCEREYPPFNATIEESLEIPEQNLPNSSGDHSPFDATAEEPIAVQEQNLPNCSISDHPPFTAIEERPIKTQEQNLPSDSSSAGRKLERNMKAKTTLEAKACSSVAEHPNCVVNVTPDSIKKNRLYIPRKFVAECGLNPQTYSVILEDENSDRWRAILCYSSLARRFRIGDGWVAYRSVHKLRAGDSLMIELVKNEGTPVFKMTRCLEGFKPSPMTEKLLTTNTLQDQDGSWPRKPHIYVTVKPYHFKLSLLRIPTAFAVKSGMNREFPEEVIIRNEREQSWTVSTWRSKIGSINLGQGWLAFARSNGIKVGDVLKLELIKKGKKPVVRISGCNSCERESPPFTATKEEELEVQEQNLPNSSCDHSPFAAMEEEPIEIQEQNLPNCSVNGSKLERNLKGKTVLGAKASSVPNCVAKVTPDGIKNNRLHIPWKFVEECGLNPQTYSIILKDENSDCWTAVLSYSSLAKRCCIGSGWASYQRVHNLKAGDSLMIKLVKNEETPVFKVTRSKMISRRNTRKSGAL